MLRAGQCRVPPLARRASRSEDVRTGISACFHGRPGQGQCRERPPAGHDRHQRPDLQRRRLQEHHRRLPQRRPGQAAGHRRGDRRHQVAAQRRLVQRQALGAAADLPPARRQHGRDRRPHQVNDASHACLDSEGRACRSDVRPLAVDPRFGVRRRVHPGAHHRPGGDGDLHLPAPLLGDRHPVDHRAARPGRHLRRDVRGELFDRQPVADGPHHRRRLRGRRRDRDDREHRALHRGGREAVRRRAEGRGPDRLHHHLDHLLADRGVHPPAVHGRHRRPAVPRVCRRRHGRRRHVGLRVAHADAGDVRPLPQARDEPQARPPEPDGRGRLRERGALLRPRPAMGVPAPVPDAGLDPPADRPHRLSLRCHPQGLLPRAGHRLHLRPGRGAAGHLVRGDGGPRQRALRRGAEGPDPGVGRRG